MLNLPSRVRKEVRIWPRRVKKEVRIWPRRIRAPAGARNRNRKNIPQIINKNISKI